MECVVCVCVCVRARVRACVRACVHVCVQYSSHSTQFSCEYIAHTCSEFSIVKIHRNTVVLRSTANTPTIHVIPSNGNNTTVLLMADLLGVTSNEMRLCSAQRDTHAARSIFFTFFSAPPFSLTLTSATIASTKMTVFT